MSAITQAKRPVHELEAALARAWTAETSIEGARWTSENPALGQCAVTAAVVQDYLGGDIWRSRIDGISHYFNVVEGTVVDLTRRQFPSGAAETDAAVSSREYVLSFPATRRRYELLKERVAELLGR